MADLVALMDGDAWRGRGELTEDIRGEPVSEADHRFLHNSEWTARGAAVTADFRSYPHQRKNGFDFIERRDGLPGRRLFLSAVPFSKNITFGSTDVQELVSLLADEPTSFQDDPAGVRLEDGVQTPGHSLPSVKSLVRPSRVRAMLASRACRSSIMIGDPLSKKEMQKVLSNLAELDSPWNCPHGRPTMRHLVDLTNIKMYTRFNTGL
ncbi:hypothetical protein L7F22_023955 [Adiantum nelumboides]|nr:hypothetical protein [Adiantum nelumboides]